MKILHVLSSLDPKEGGPVEALRGLVLAQRALGLEISVLATWSKGQNTDLAKLLEEQGVSVSLVGPCWTRLRWHSGLAAKTAQCVASADLVHIHALWEEVQHQASRAAWQSRRPFIIRPCGMLDPWSLRQSKWIKRFYLRCRLRKHLDRAAAIHFTTATERDLTAPLALRAPSLVEPNGIDASSLDTMPPIGLFRDKLQIPPGQLLVLFLGRLHPKKGLELLLPAFAQSTRDALLVVAGPDSNNYQTQLLGLAKTLGITHRVRFTGILFGPEKWSALRDADLFVLPSYQENFGIAVVEALAAGTPVLISDQVNLNGEIQQAGVGGVVPLKVEALQRELSVWTSETERRREAATRAVAFVRDRFLWDAIAHRWVGHYERLIAAHSRTRKS